MGMKERLDNFLTMLLAVCAITVTVVVVRREVMARATTGLQAAHVDDWESYATGIKRIGPDSAPVTIVALSDFQCPFCAQAAQVLTKVLRQHPNDVSIVFRSFPIEQLHPHARAAALAAECAASQDRFGAFHDITFQLQDSIGILSWRTLATRAGVSDVTRFDACLTGPDVNERLADDIAAAKRLAVAGTPTILVNGLRLEGVPAEERLQVIIVEELERR